jgi:hypothetical protein
MAYTASFISEHLLLDVDIDTPQNNPIFVGKLSMTHTLTPSDGMIAIVQKKAINFFRADTVQRTSNQSQFSAEIGNYVLRKLYNANQNTTANGTRSIY